MSDCRLQCSARVYAALFAAVVTLGIAELFVARSWHSVPGVLASLDTPVSFPPDRFVQIVKRAADRF